MKHHFLLLFCLCLPGLAWSQTFSISGQVKGPDDQSIGAAQVTATIRGQMPQGALTDEQGRFVISDLPPGLYFLEINMAGFRPFKRPVSIKTDSRDLGQLTLKAADYQLEEVVIEREVPPAIQKGDTTELNSDAFKTNPDANVENLIEKMPGITVNNGQVTAQGEQVQQVLVDGREFFGSDPSTALRNLPAEVVAKIQVFDQQSEQAQQTGVDDGETVKTINIVTKLEMRNGSFGTQYAGVGWGDEVRYQAGGSYNMFNDARRISILGQVNNINKQNFSSEDLLGVMSAGGGGRRGFGGGGRGGPGGGGSVGEFLVGEQGGISETQAFGVNYTDEWGESWEVTSSYFFNRSDNLSEQKVLQQYLSDADSSQIYEEGDTALTVNMNHRLSARLRYRKDRHSLSIRPQFSMQVNDGTNFTLGQTMVGKGLVNQSLNDFSAHLVGMNLRNSLSYRYRFEKRGRSLSSRMNLTYTNNSGDNLLQSSIGYYTLPILLDSLNQQGTLLTNGWNLSGNIQYTEPISRKATLSFTYTAEPQFTDSDQRTQSFSSETQAYSLLDTLLSNTFRTQYMSHRVGTGLMYRAGKGFFIARLEAQQAVLDNQSQFPRVNSTSFQFRNLLPFLMYRLRLENQGNLRVIYRGRTNPPSISQLQDVIDNSNPLQLSTGNPNLKQDYQHFFMARYNSTNTEKNRTFMGFVSGQVTENYLASSSLIASADTVVFDYLVPAGTQLTQPVNLDGYWNVRSLLNYGKLLEALKLNVNLSLSGDYNRRPGLVNGISNFTHTATLGGGLVLSSNISEKIDFTLSTRSSYSDVTNSVLTRQNTQYYNQSSMARVNIIVGPGIVFRSELNHSMYRGLSEAFNTDFWLWNASIGKKLFKNQRGELQLSVFDMLRQNTSIQRNVTELYIEDVQTAVLQRYAMLTFTYQLRNFNSSGLDPTEAPAGPGGFGPPPGGPPPGGFRRN